MDWDHGRYAAFSDLRLRPALDLLARIPRGDAAQIVDLGCGGGAAAPALRARFPEARLIGVDPSATMLEAAGGTGLYAALEEDDAAAYAASAGAQPDVLFSNAALHWAPDHRDLFPALLARVAPGGVFAAQMPRQFNEPSHDLLWKTARALFPERFPDTPPEPPVADPAFYRALLAPSAQAFDLWETVYHQRLAPIEAGLHPVAAFTRSTAARPYLEEMAGTEREHYLTAYSQALGAVYPQDPDGGAWLPFRRLFLVALRES